MKAFVFLLVISLSLFSCSKDNASMQEQEVPATIQTMIDSYNEGGCTCLPVIVEYNWKGQTVYVLAYRGRACNWTPAYYDKEGKIISMPASLSYDAFLAQSQLVRKVWSCD